MTAAGINAPCWRTRNAQAAAAAPNRRAARSGRSRAEPSHITVGGDDQQRGEERIAHEGVGEHEAERVEHVGRGRERTRHARDLELAAKSVAGHTAQHRHHERGEAEHAKAQPKQRRKERTPGDLEQERHHGKIQDVQPPLAQQDLDRAGVDPIITDRRRHQHRHQQGRQSEAGHDPDDAQRGVART